MIALPPGVTVNQHVKIVIASLDIDAFTWFRDIGAKIWVEEWYDGRGRRHERPRVQIGRGKPSYNLQDGSGHVLLDFRIEDAGTALAFLMKFDTHVVSHNMRDMERYYVS